MIKEENIYGTILLKIRTKGTVYKYQLELCISKYN